MMSKLKILNYLNNILTPLKILYCIEYAKNEERLSLSLQEVRYEIDKLEGFISDLKKYLQNNMNSDLAPSILENTNILIDAMNKKNLEELLSVNRDINNFIIKNDIKGRICKTKKENRRKNNSGRSKDRG